MAVPTRITECEYLFRGKKLCLIVRGLLKLWGACRCVRAELDIPGHSNLNVFVTHFSFDRSQQLSNVKDVKKFVMRHATPQILMGDLNVYLDYDAPMRELMRADDGSVLFRDAWLESHPHPIDQSATAEEKAKQVRRNVLIVHGLHVLMLPFYSQLGYTFSSWDPHNRADRILVRGPGIQVTPPCPSRSIVALLFISF